MKALRIIYFVVWLYFVGYACYMVYELLGEKAVPLFAAGITLFVVKWLVGF